MTEAWAWLPEGALEHPSVRAGVDEILRDWCGRWFASHDLQVRRIGAWRPAAADIFRVQAAGVGLRCTSAQTVTLLSQALDLDLNHIEVSDNDQTLIDRFAKAMLQDLADGMAAKVTDGENKPGLDLRHPSGLVEIVVGDPDGSTSLSIHLPRAFANRLRIEALPEPASTRDRYTSLMKAVGPAQVTLNALLGSVSLALPDARRLAKGDVIILDQALEEPSILSEAVSGAPVAAGRIVDTTYPLSLSLLSLDDTRRHDYA